MTKNQTVAQALEANPRLRERALVIDEKAMTTTAVLNGHVDLMNAARDKSLGADADIRNLHENYGHLQHVDDREDPGSDKRDGILPLSVIDKYEAAVSSARAELNRATINKNRAATEKNVAAHFADQKDHYLARAMANGGIGEVSVKLPRGATAEGARAELADMRSHRKLLENSIAPITAANIRTLVGEKAAPARLAISPRGRGQIEHPIVRVAAEPISAGHIPNAPDALALFCRYAPEAVIADLTAQAEKMAGDRMVLTAEQKAKKLAEIDAEILRLQRIEAELIWQARAEGRDVWFSKGLDIRAVLGIDGIAPK